MDEHSKKLLERYSINTDKYNQRFFVLSLVAWAICLIVIVCTLITICHLNSNMKDMSVKQWETYMTTDYYYPDMMQEQKVEVNQ